MATHMSIFEPWRTRLQIPDAPPIVLCRARSRVQYPGPTTRENPICADRFNMAERKSVADERIDM